MEQLAKKEIKMTIEELTEQKKVAEDLAQKLYELSSKVNDIIDTAIGAVQDAVDSLSDVTLEITSNIDELTEELNDKAYDLEDEISDLEDAAVEETGFVPEPVVSTSNDPLANGRTGFLPG